MKTFQQILNTAYDLYNGSSSTIDEWILEFLDYVCGKKDTIWNEPEFKEWSEEEKEKCFSIILELYRNKIERGCEA